MNNQVITGNIAVYGSDINTDDITKADLLKYSAKTEEGLEQLALGCLARKPTVEGLPFMEKGAQNTQYDIIIAGPNFGCGSSREQSPYALAAAGVELIIAPDFAPIFWNNSFSSDANLVLRRSSEDLTKIVSSGDYGIYDPEIGNLTIRNSRNGHLSEIELKFVSDKDQKLEVDGGILNYAVKHFKY